MSAESHRQLQSREFDQAPSLTWPSAALYAKAANNGLIDLLAGIDDAELHYSHVDLGEKSGGPIASLGQLAADENEPARTRSHVFPALFTKEPIGPIWSDGRESWCNVHKSLKRIQKIEKSGTERNNTGSFSPIEEERPALNKVKDSLKYEKERYCVAVPRKQKFGFIKRVDKGWITTVKVLESWCLGVSPSSERIEELWGVVVYMRV